MAQPLHIIPLAELPDLLALHACYPERYPHLLSSNTNAIGADKNNQLARYDILFACPQQTIAYQDGQSENEFLQQLDQAWLSEKISTELCDLPFKGGWFVYLGYELVQQIEPALQLAKAEDGLPTAFATRFPAAIILDAHKNTAYLICEAEFDTCRKQIEADLSSPLNSELYQQAFQIQDFTEDDEQAYLQQLKKLHQYIIDGDVFQVNLSRRWHTELTNKVNHASVYHQLCQANPGPFNALVTLGDKAILSSSPERLIEVKDNYVQTRPIAGTRPRSVDQQTDTNLSTELLAHPKERAEHIMLIDLERNDLGRVCEPGSIEVDELMVLESYQHVHHIVSNVKGRLRDGMNPGETIAAVFPGGTITGCPKVRCMEILAELEQTGRGAYTGSLGYINHDGSMDLNILIRTICRDGNKLQFRAGGGIVVDSNPQNELNETRAKAKGMIQALLAGQTLNGTMS